MGIVGGTRRAVGRMVVAACVGSLLLGTAGCTAPSTPASTSNPPTIAPIFASDEEALAAATAAYENYLSVHDAFWADSGASAEDFLSLSVDSANEGDSESIDSWRNKGWRSTGSTTFDSIRLQSVESIDSTERISTYLCLDVSQSDVIDESGVSVARPDRPRRLPLEVEFETTSREGNDMKVSRSEVWSGEDFC